MINVKDDNVPESLEAFRRLMGTDFVLTKLGSLMQAVGVHRGEVFRHVLFIGNPGIGKTWSLNYFLYKSAE